jgi:choline dehydrogenase
MSGRGSGAGGWSTCGIISTIAFIVIAGVVLGLGIWAQNNHSQKAPPCCFTPECANSETSPDCEVDIVINGCGSAGAYLANVLSAQRSDGSTLSVVCLESGKYYNNDPSVKYVTNGGIPWQFIVPRYAKTAINSLSDPDPNLGGFQTNMQQGTMVGGSGSHDNGVLVYPSPNQTKVWASVGGSQWDYDNVVALINSYEQFLGTPNASCPHGTSGLLANWPDYANTGPGEVTYDFMQAIVQASPTDNGVAEFTQQMNCGQETLYTNNIQTFYRPINSTLLLRSSPGVDYLGLDTITPQGFGVNGRPLRVLTETIVNRFVIDPNTMQATHVEAIVAGQQRRFYARKQIIVAMNGVNSPGLLERSGVGNPSILSAMGVPTVVASPEVGENFQYHGGSTFVFYTNQTTNKFNFVSSQGLLNMQPGTDNTRNIQIFMLPNNVISGKGTSLCSPIPPGFTPISLIISNINPKSHGSVHINSRNPRAFPSIQTNFYSDPGNEDFLLMNTTLTVIYQALLNLRAANPQFSYEIANPPESVFQNATQLRNFILNYPFFQAHWSSTCSMGTVLDGNLKLNGVNGVTVADTSSLNQISNGNTRTQALLTAAQAAKYLLATL